MNPVAADLYDQIEILLQAAEFRQVIDLCRSALTDARRKSNTHAEIMALIGWSAAHKYIGAFGEARILVDGAVKKAEQADSPQLLALALNTSGSIHLVCSLRAEDAEQDYRAALDIAYDVDDHVGVATALAGIGASLLSVGDASRAKRFALEAFDTARDIDDKYLMAGALSLIGSAMLEGTDEEATLKAFQDALNLVREHGLRLLEGTIVGNIGLALLKSSRYYEDGISMLERSLEMAEKISCVPHEYSALHRLGTAYQQLGRFKEAQDYYDTVLTRTQTWGARAYEGAAFFTLGLLAYADKRTDAALADLHQAAGINREMMNPYREAMTDMWLGMIYADKRDFSNALKHYNNARTIYDSLDDDTRVRQMTQIVVWVHILKLWDGLLRFVGIRSKDDEDENKAA